ncbi:MAG: shikimate kinase [Flavobacteriales bacterium]|nr:shikimate kinase [Flavobacteriales bacterium]
MGLPFSGKSTTANFLSKALARKVISTDALICEKSGLTIEEWFSLKGELAFRKMEREVLHELLGGNEPLIIDTGGGLPCFYDNMEHLCQSATVIWLDTAPAVLAARSLLHADRPLLLGLAPDLTKRTEYFSILRLERMPFYSKASWIYRTDGNTQERWIRTYT